LPWYASNRGRLGDGVRINPARKERHMLVKYWMRKVVVTADTDDSMQLAASLMKEYSTHLLPVLKKGRLVGVLTDRDLKRASPSPATSLDLNELTYLLSQIKVGDIMTRGAITVPPNYTLEEAATLLLENQISGAPVVDDAGQIKGIISQREIFQALVSLSGLRKRGVLFAFEVDDVPGSIKEITDIIRLYEGRLVSIFSSYERAPEGRRLVYIRAFQLDRTRIPEMQQELRQKGKLLYLIDHTEETREEYIELDVQEKTDLSSLGAAPSTIKKILFCTDFSINSVPAQSYALELAKRLGAQLMVLHVVSARVLGHPAFDNALPDTASELQQTVDEVVGSGLDKVLQECRKEIPEATGHLCSGEPAAEIVPFARKHVVDLIVLGTHGWTGLKHLILGSVAENVVRTAHCPVLTVRSSGAL